MRRSSPAAGTVIREDVRNNTRVIMDNRALAARLWERATPWITAYRERAVIGLNERFRFYRYEPGQYFAPHLDQPFERENGERSEFTFLMYLNDDFAGGHTVFHHPRLDVHPEAGSALVFHHPNCTKGLCWRKG